MLTFCAAGKRWPAGGQAGGALRGTADFRNGRDTIGVRNAMAIPAIPLAVRSRCLDVASNTEPDRLGFVRLGVG